MKKKLLSLLFIFFLVKSQNDDFVVIPLGESCGVTAALEIFNLKKASYPFEWCISNFMPLYNSLKNDFVDFVNPDYFTFYTDKFLGYAVKIKMLLTVELLEGIRI